MLSSLWKPQICGERRKDATGRAYITTPLSPFIQLTTTASTSPFHFSPYSVPTLWALLCLLGGFSQSYCGGHYTVHYQEKVKPVVQRANHFPLFDRFELLLPPFWASDGHFWPKTAQMWEGTLGRHRGVLASKFSIWETSPPPPPQGSMMARVPKMAQNLRSFGCKQPRNQEWATNQELGYMAPNQIPRAPSAPLSPPPQPSTFCSFHPSNCAKRTARPPYLCPLASGKLQAPAQTIGCQNG